MQSCCQYIIRYLYLLIYLDAVCSCKLVGYKLFWLVMTQISNDWYLCYLFAFLCVCQHSVSCFDFLHSLEAGGVCFCYHMVDCMRTQLFIALCLYFSVTVYCISRPNEIPLPISLVDQSQGDCLISSHCIISQRVTMSNLVSLLFSVFYNPYFEDHRKCQIDAITLIFMKQDVIC